MMAVSLKRNGFSKMTVKKISPKLHYYYRQDLFTMHRGIQITTL